MDTMTEDQVIDMLYEHGLDVRPMSVGWQRLITNAITGEMLLVSDESGRYNVEDVVACAGY